MVKINYLLRCLAPWNMAIPTRKHSTSLRSTAKVKQMSDIIVYNIYMVYLVTCKDVVNFQVAIELDLKTVGLVQGHKYDVMTHVVGFFLE